MSCLFIFIIYTNVGILKRELNLLKYISRQTIENIMAQNQNRHIFIRI